MNKSWQQIKLVFWKAGEGELLEGLYAGSTQRRGQYGEYECHIVQTAPGTFMAVAGVVPCSLFKAAALEDGRRVRLVFAGWVETEDAKYKDYNLFVEVENEYVPQKWTGKSVVAPTVDDGETTPEEFADALFKMGDLD